MKLFTARSKNIHNKKKKGKRYSRIKRMRGGSKKNALCLLVRKPNVIWLDFLNGFSDMYDLYVVIDDNTVSLNDFISKYPSIKFLQFNDYECKAAGFWDVNYLMNKEVTAWDKSLYYFCIKNTSYDYVWFCEEDVFFYNKEILTNIDKKHSKADLLCTNLNHNISGELTSWWHWYKAKDLFNLPWSAALVCMCRMSRKLLERVKAFSEQHKKLEFLEVLFAILAHQNNMSIEEPEEFSGITFPVIPENNVDNSNRIYHAVKNIEQHAKYRSKK